MSSSPVIVPPQMSPACFACYASRGRWKLAPHLSLIDTLLLSVATGKPLPRHLRAAMARTTGLRPEEMDRPIDRLLVELPPRHGKSQLISKYFPAWFMGMYPDRDFILTSATDDLAQVCSQEARDLAIEYGPSVFGRKVRPDVRATHHWQMEAGGSVQAAGVNGDIIGRGARCLIVDDFVRNAQDALSETVRESQDRWFMSTVRSRLAPAGAVVIMATRWHRKDLIGKRLAEMSQGGDRWARVRLPALAEEDDPLGRKPGEPLWPAMFSLDWLNRTRNSYVVSGYDWMWEALYQQNPPEVLDSEFSPSCFGDHLWFDEWPPEDSQLLRVIAIDPSVTGKDRADYSAIVMLVYDGHFWYADADIQRRDAFRTVDDGLACYRRFRPYTMAVESVAFSAMLAPMMRQRAAEIGLGGVKVFPLPVTRDDIQGIRPDKRERIRYRLTERLNKRQIKFMRGSPGASLLVEQIQGFPSCKHDDGPDALEMALYCDQQIRTGGGQESADGGVEFEQAAGW